MPSFSGFILSSVLLLLAPADKNSNIFVVKGVICYALPFSTIPVCGGFR
jgi:hypothetical protein